MATIRSTIELFDAFSSPMERIINVVHSGVSSVERMWSAMNNSNIDTSPLEVVEAQLGNATNAAQQFDAALQGVSAPSNISFSQTQFDTGAIANFQAQVSSAASALQRVGNAQNRINAQAHAIEVVPKETAKK